MQIKTSITWYDRDLDMLAEIMKFYGLESRASAARLAVHLTYTKLRREAQQGEGPGYQVKSVYPPEDSLSKDYHKEVQSKMKVKITL